MPMNRDYATMPMALAVCVLAIGSLAIWGGDPLHAAAQQDSRAHSTAPPPAPAKEEMASDDAQTVLRRNTSHATTPTNSPVS